jgi:hypothetical protein
MFAAVAFCRRSATADQGSPDSAKIGVRPATQALPFKEAMEKLEKNGTPKVPLGTKLSTLLHWGKK